MYKTLYLKFSSLVPSEQVKIYKKGLVFPQVLRLESIDAALRDRAKIPHFPTVMQHIAECKKVQLP